jgi:hypothetical protein
MKFFNELRLIESHQSAKREANHVIQMVNAVYAEWKKTGRRKNAVDLITTTANKLSTISTDTVPQLHEATRLKIASLIVRVFDIPYWKSVGTVEKIYKKLYPLITTMETYSPETGTGGNLRDVLMTRLSASVTYNSENKDVFVGYEPKITESYLRYLFSDNKPKRTFRMQALKLPEDFGNLVDNLKINHEKCVAKFKKETESENKD